MKWFLQKRKSIWDTHDNWKARNSNCELTVTERNDGTYYFLVSNGKNSINYNSLWQNLSFQTAEFACDEAARWLAVYLDPSKGGKTE